MGVKVTLRQGRERPVLNSHPWIFSGAVGRTEPEEPEPGSLCEIYGADGSWLAAGYINPHSQIICRLVTRLRKESWDKKLLKARLEQAAGLRERICPPDTDSYRLVNSEGDGLPGIIVDRYGKGFVIQLLTAGAERMREEVTRLLIKRFDPAFIYENSTSSVRVQEGLSEVRQALHGEPAPRVGIVEYGHRFLVDIYNGQKTGFYLDQRENRRIAAEWTRPGARALNLFAYTGAFAVYLARAGAARVISVESSEKALDLARENLAAAELSESGYPVLKADAFEYLRKSSDEFDLIVIDPPPFAKRSIHVKRASRSYKDINRLGLTRLAPGGVILTFSCSGHVGTHLFRQIVFSSAVEAGRQVQVLARLGPGADHPVSIYHPEGEYLTGLLLYAP
ncbi:MAG TPA: class I SAM-dependent rRNA methyltransferase [archaeon]|nr:class I SAM-dependent rRNA methyltransferase [archaeon]